MTPSRTTPMPADTPPRRSPPRRWWRRDAPVRLVPKPRSSARNTATHPTRVLLVNQHYWPDHASTAQHLTDLAESLAAQGYEVHVLCAQGRYHPGAGDA